MNIIGDNVGAWLATTIVAVLTIYSDKIIGRIRFSLNRADLRTKYFEELALDLSTFIYWAEIYYERFQKGWTDDPENLGAIGGELNEAMTTLRKKEYLYRSWVKKYWRADALERFVGIMDTVKAVGAAYIAFNDAGNEERKIANLGREINALHSKLEQWLSQSSV